MNKVIVLDPGHGGSDPGAVANGLREKDLNLVIALETRRYLQDNYQGHQVVMTRTTDEYVSLAKRVAISNEAKADLFASLHNNAMGASRKGEGFESFISSGYLNPQTVAYQNVIHGEIYGYIQTLGRPDRGKKRNNFYVLVNPLASCVLFEYLFLTDAVDAAFLRRDDYLKEFGRRTAIGIAKALGLPTKVSGGTLLLGDPVATPAQCYDYILRKTAARDIKLSHQKVNELVQLYWKHGQLTGVRPDILFAQGPCHETGCLTFERSAGVPGAVTVDQNNFAGVKIRNPVGDRREDHESFTSMEEGVRAHFNHLLAYLGLEPIGMPHDRFYVVKSLYGGKVDTIEQLSGKYAPSKTYHESVLAHYQGIVNMPGKPAVFGTQLKVGENIKEYMEKAGLTHIVVEVSGH